MAVITSQHIALAPRLAGSEEEHCTPLQDKTEINNWDFSQRADLSPLPIKPALDGSLMPISLLRCERGVFSTQPMFMGSLTAASSSQKIFPALCFPSAVCSLVRTTAANGSPARVSNSTSRT